MSDPNAGRISITNPDLDWSPYNWHFNGSTFAETQSGGGYVKIAFSGNTLGIHIDTSTQQVGVSQMLVDAYIDGSTTPIQMNLAQASNNLLTFTNSLSSGNHYAVIYLSFDPCGCNNRWLEGQASLRITGLQLATDGSGSILPLTGTPLQKETGKILIYGDSITEGYNTSGSEYEYSAILGRTLGDEYGQVGYRGGGWNIAVDGVNADFYNIGDTAGSWYAGYDNQDSRFITPNVPSSGLLDGTPDAVYNNLGVNDYYDTTSPNTMTTKITDWLVDMRSALGARPAIFMVVPFDFGNTSNSAEQAYKAAWIAGVTNYQAAHPSDTRVFVVDLGATGYNIVQANSNDSPPKVHPNDTGAALLGAAIDQATASEISTVLSAGTLSAISSPTQTTSNLATTAPTGGIAPYTYQWYRSTTAGFTPGVSTLLTGDTSNTLSDSGLTADKTYYYKVVYGDSTDPDQSVTSAAFSVTTPAVTVVTPVTPTTTTTTTTTSSSPSTLTTLLAADTKSKPSTSTTNTIATGDTTPTTVAAGTIDGTAYTPGTVPTTSASPTISGTAPPYSQVTVTFHSVVETCETNADANGNWSCHLGQTLPAGVHTVDITALTTDGQTLTFPSYQIKVVSSVTPAVTSLYTSLKPAKHHHYAWIYVVVLLLVVIAGFVVVGRARTNKKSTEN